MVGGTAGAVVALLSSGSSRLGSVGVGGPGCFPGVPDVKKPFEAPGKEFVDKLDLEVKEVKDSYNLDYEKVKESRNKLEFLVNSEPQVELGLGDKIRDLFRTKVGIEKINRERLDYSRKQREKEIEEESKILEERKLSCLSLQLDYNLKCLGQESSRIEYLEKLYSRIYGSVDKKGKNLGLVRKLVKQSTLSLVREKLISEYKSHLMELSSPYKKCSAGTERKFKSRLSSLLELQERIPEAASVWTEGNYIFTNDKIEILIKNGLYESAFKACIYEAGIGMSVTFHYRETYDLKRMEIVFPFYFRQLVEEKDFSRAGRISLNIANEYLYFTNGHSGNKKVEERVRFWSDQASKMYEQAGDLESAVACYSGKLTRHGEQLKHLAKKAEESGEFFLTRKIYQILGDSKNFERVSRLI